MSGFFKRARITDARHSQFNIVGENQYNTNVTNITNITYPMVDQDVLGALKPVDRSSYYVSPCMRGTRQWVTDKICCWLDDDQAPNILLLTGSPGAGKSAIASTMVSKLGDMGRLGSSFFCKRGDATLGDPTVFWRTVAFDLAQRDEVFAEKLIKNVKDRKVDLTRPDIQSHFDYLVRDPLMKMRGRTATQEITAGRKLWPLYRRRTQEASNLPFPVIVLDGLDECGSDSAQSTQRRIFMDTITGWSHLDPSVKLLITSRDYQIPPPLRKVCCHIPLETGELVASETNTDIQTFFERRFADIASNFPTLQSWPSSSVIEELTNRAAGSFIWADTVVRFLEHGFPKEQLDRILSNAFRSEGDAIDQLYQQILQVSFADPAVLDTFRRVTGAIILSKTPLYRSELIYFIGKQEDESSIDFILRGLSSVISTRGAGSRIHISHLSFAEFLCDPKRCPEDFLIDCSAQSRVMTLSCFQAMQKCLRFNICDIKTSYHYNVDLELAPRIEKAIPTYLQYACCFWAEHLECAAVDVALADEVRDFLNFRLLYWLEVLSVIKKTGTASRALTLVGEWSKTYDEDIVAFAADGGKFIASFETVISQSAPHIYLSALPFAPKESRVSRQYLPQYPRTLLIQTGQATEWPAILNVPMSQTRRVMSVAFSPDGRRVVSGSEDMVIRIWDAETGEATCSPFEGHTGQIRSVAFSHDGRHVVSASDDRTICIWDVETRKPIVFKGHTDFVRSAAFSGDSRRVVSGSHDRTIRIWDVETGEHACRTFQGHTDRILSVTFSHDGNYVFSGAADMTIRVWDAKTGSSVPLIGHTDWIYSIAISNDGRHLVSGSVDRTIRVWDVQTRECICAAIEGHAGFVRSVAFSPDGKRVISGSDDRTIRIWDAETGKPTCAPYKGHTGFVRSVAFSYDGKRVVSASDDKTIHIWDAETREPAFEGYTAWTKSVAFSHESKCIVSDSDDRTIHEWVPETNESTFTDDISFSRNDKRVMPGLDARTIRVWSSQTNEPILASLDGHTDFVRSVSFSHDGRSVVSGSSDKTIRIWDAKTGKLQRAFEGHTDHVYSVAFSNNGSRVISGSADRTICVWDAETSNLISAPFEGHTDYVYSIAISNDGKWVISGSADKTIRIWDAETGKPTCVLEGHTAWVRAVAFSSDGKLIVSGSDDKTIRIWNAQTGALIRGPLREHVRWVTCVAFSHDGSLVVSGSGDKTIRIWGVKSGRPRGAPFESHTDFVRSVAFSHDNTRVVSGSGDATIRIWDTGTGEPIRVLKGHMDIVSCVAFSHDDKHVVSVSKDMAIRIWDVQEREVFPSGSTITFQDDSEMLDGWILGQNSELLFWVPPAHRTALWRLSNVCVIGKNSTKLDMSYFVHGSSWQHCEMRKVELEFAEASYSKVEIDGEVKRNRQQQEIGCSSTVG